MPLTPNESSVQEAVGDFIKLMLPGVEVVEGQDTAVPEPIGGRFVVVTPTSRPRLATNLVLYADCQVFASVSGTTLTVASVKFGTVVPGARLWGVQGTVADGTTIVSQLELSPQGEPGGVGKYALSGAPQSSGLQVMACGEMSLWSDFELILQLDVHGSNPRDATDMVGVLSGVFRDPVATDYFDSLHLGVSPLHADDPRQAPFLNAEQAWETRWTLDAHFEVNQRIPLPMQFMTDVVVQIRPVQ